MRVIVIHAPGLNVNWLGAYGNEWVRTPHLDRFASEAVVFDQHHSANPDPDAVEDAWHAGDYLLPGAPEGERDFVNHLPRLGVPCVRLSDGRDDITDAEGWDGTNVEPGELVDAAIDALEQLREVPAWLLWLDATRSLPPWEVFDELFDEYERDWIPPESFEEVPDLEPLADPPTGPFDAKNVVERERLHRSFATVVSAFDLEIGGLIEETRERGLDTGVVWVFTAGYGWPLAEHDIVGPHSAELREESVHVPLIVRFADRAEAGRRVDAFTQNVDILPTLLELFGVDAGGLHGRSVLPLARGEVQSIRDYAVMGGQVGEGVEWAVRSPDWCFQTTRGGAERPGRLYEKPADRWEVNELRQQHLDWTDQLELMLDAFAAASVQPGEPIWPTLPVEHEESVE